LWLYSQREDSPANLSGVQKTIYLVYAFGVGEMTRREGFGAEVVEKAIAVQDFSGFTLTRASNGVSTEVYRMEKGPIVLYLRVANGESSLWPEAEAHRRCREKGVLVPEIIFFDEKNPVLNRSVMITSEIPGQPWSEEGSAKVIREAGRNLALINSIPIDGIGWMNDDPEIRRLTGRGTSYDDFILDNIDKKVAKLIGFGLFDDSMAKRTIQYIQKRAGILREYQHGGLAHGDFDLSHIFTHNGQFSGIIDFGDIRSTSLYHDLAHFFTYARKHFPDLLVGYLETTKLNNDYEERIRIEAVVMAVGKLCWVGEKRINKLNQNRADYKMIRELVR